MHGERKESVDKRDVIVVGGGAAGIGASLAAARAGASTLLIERYGFLGGMATAGLVNHWDPIKLMEITGIARELYDELDKRKALLDFPFDNVEMPFTYWEAGCGFDAEVLKRVELELLRKSGVDLLLHSFVTGVLGKGSAVEGVVVHSKSGREEVRGKFIIDATGDGDIAAWAGAPFQKGTDDGELMACTLCFMVGGVNTAKLRQYLLDNPDEFAVHPRLGKFIKNVDRSSIWQGFHKAIKQAREAHDLTIPLPEPGIGMVRLPIEGQFHVNVTHTPGIDGTDARSLTRGEINERDSLQQLFPVMKKYIPGFENAYLLSTPAQIGIRETRRIKGDYYLTIDDFRHAKRFNDAIMQGKWAHSDIHSGKEAGRGEQIKWEFEMVEGPYQVPYRCLVPQGFDNIIVGGRSIWTDRKVNGTLRSQPMCTATGQAAGVAAALAAASDKSLRDIRIGKVQDVLRQQGARIDV